MTVRSNGCGTPLDRKLRETIRRTGPVGVDAFMRLALQDPEHGYYRRSDAIGVGGDFVTAPEISQMFGELICMWIADCWQRAGRPRPMQIVELGPGRGTLMSDVLRSARAVAGFREALRPALVETNRTLAARQRELLGQDGIRWASSLEEVPSGPAFWIANEFLDAMPIRQFVRMPDSWRERRVGMDDAERLTWVAGAPVELPAPLSSSLSDAPEGRVAEWSDETDATVRRIARRVAESGGAGLFVDYGYEEPELAGALGGDTLQAVRAHRFAPVLDAVGEADLSAHVNFSALARAAGEEGVSVGPVTSQGQFLESIGARLRAASLSRGKPRRVREAIEAALERLVGNDGMGRLFRVLAIRAREWPEPAGFDLGRPS